MIDVRVVAQYFLWKSSMSHKKLEKMCYYAQAWYLANVYNVYGDYTADELESLTHGELPWENARKGCSPSAYSRNPISMKDMRNYYGERIGKTYE